MNDCDAFDALFDYRKYKTNNTSHSPHNRKNFEMNGAKNDCQTFLVTAIAFYSPYFFIFIQFSSYNKVSTAFQVQESPTVRCPCRHPPSTSCRQIPSSSRRSRTFGSNCRTRMVAWNWKTSSISKTSTKFCNCWAAVAPVLIVLKSPSTKTTTASARA